MPPAIPIATYRLQLTANFGFDAAAVVVPYLKALGITHLYAKTLPTVTTSLITPSSIRNSVVRTASSG
jgi:maltooligosyltrehalose synthase